MGENNLNAKRSFQLSLTFVLSMSVTYALAGIAAGYLGRTVQTILQQPWLIISFSLLFVMMALSMFGLFTIALPRSLHNYLLGRNQQQSGGRFTSVALMGVLSTLVASPCVTAPLISVLMYISQTGNSLYGGLILFTLALGMGLPLILFGMGQGYLLPKTGAWMNRVKNLFGILMLGLAVWMLSRLLSDSMILLLWGCYLMAAVVLFLMLEMNAGQRLSKVSYGIIAAVLIGGIGLVISSNRVASVIVPSQVSHALANHDFILVHNNAELNKALEMAKAEHKPVLVDFYASWCSDCRRVDKEIFADPIVRQHLQSFTNLRVDVTTENDDLIVLKNRYQIYAIPTFIFYDKNGKQLADNQFVEEIGKPGLLKLMAQLER